MKKVLLATMLVAAVAVNAQSFKPEVGKFGMEVAVSGLTDIDLQGGALVGTYSFSENIGFRLGLGFNSTSTTSDNGDSGAALRKFELSINQFTIAPGIVYSFAGTEKLTPYVGAEFLLGSTSNKITATRGTASGNHVETTENINGNMFGINFEALNTFGFNVFTGFNYYFAKNLYIGAECGLGIVSVSEKNWKITETGVDNQEGKDKNGGFGMGVGCNTSLRLGWAF